MFLQLKHSLKQVPKSKHSHLDSGSKNIELTPYINLKFATSKWQKQTCGDDIASAWKLNWDLNLKIRVTFLWLRQLALQRFCVLFCSFVRLCFASISKISRCSLYRNSCRLIPLIRTLITCEILFPVAWAGSNSLRFWKKYTMFNNTVFICKCGFHSNCQSSNNENNLLRLVGFCSFFFAYICVKLIKRYLRLDIYPYNGDWFNHLLAVTVPTRAM